MACRLPRYLAIIRMSSSQEALDGLDGVGERTPLGIGERCLAHAPYPIRGVRAALEPRCRGHQAREPALACIVRVRIAFDEAARFEEFDTERAVAARSGQGLVEPGLRMHPLAAVAQRAAPEAPPARHGIEQQEPADGARVHTPAAIDHVSQRRHETGAPLDPLT